MENARKAATKIFTACAAFAASSAAVIGGVTYAAYDPEPAPQEVTDRAVNDLLRSERDPAYLTLRGHDIENVGRIAVLSVDQQDNKLCADYATIAFRPTFDDPMSDFKKQLANKKTTCVSYDSPEI